MVEIVKELKGLSGSHVTLMRDGDRFFVEKRFNTARNLERYRELGLNGIRVPKIYSTGEDIYTMEFIPGTMMKEYFIYNGAKRFSEYFIGLMDKFSITPVIKNYRETYIQKLSKIDFNEFSFTMMELVDRLPQVLPSGLYHGDMTLDNIIFNDRKDEFVLIDPLTSEYDSFVFDIAKFGQDVRCGWFIRKDKINLSSVLQTIYDEVFKRFPEIISNNELLILMLLRVYPYCLDEFDRKFIIKEVNRLWI